MFDLVILDLNLPQMGGLAVLRSMRQRANQAAVLILSARGAPEERVRGLDLGADDYMAKPFDVAELQARVRSILRRQAGLKSSVVSLAGVTFDLKTRRFTTGTAELDLPPRERALLELLFLRPGNVVTKEAIVQSLTSIYEILSDNAIEQYVSRLRRRIAPHGLAMKTARGLGYYIERGAE